MVLPLLSPASVRLRIATMRDKAVALAKMGFRIIPGQTRVRSSGTTAKQTKASPKADTTSIFRLAIPPTWRPYRGRGAAGRIPLIRHRDQHRGTFGAGHRRPRRPHRERRRLSNSRGCTGLTSGHSGGKHAERWLALLLQATDRHRPHHSPDSVATSWAAASTTAVTTHLWWRPAPNGPTGSPGGYDPRPNGT